MGCRQITRAPSARRPHRLRCAAVAGRLRRESQGRAADAIAPQLAYLEPGSSLVAALDLRYEGENWQKLRPLLSRMLRVYRDQFGGDTQLEIPLNIEGALTQLAAFAGLDFKADLAPALDGYLVVGVTTPPREPLPAHLAAVRRATDGVDFDFDGACAREFDPATGKRGRVLRTPEESR